MTGFPTTVDLAKRQSIEELNDEGPQGHSRRERRVVGPVITNACERVLRHNHESGCKWPGGERPAAAVGEL